MWKVKSTIDWWVASEKGMVNCLVLSTLTCFLLHSVECEEHHWLMSCIWGRYGALLKVSYSPLAFVFTYSRRWGAPLVVESHLKKLWCLGKVRYSHLAFDYIILKVRSTIGIGLVRCIWGNYCALLKFSYSTLAFVFRFSGRWGSPLVFESHLKKLWCLSMVRYSHLAFDYIMLKMRITMKIGFSKVHLRKE